MRSPDAGALRHPSGRTFEDELSVQYLSPGSFTIIATQEDEDEDPIQIQEEPVIPQPFRLTPNTRKRRNQSFAIIAEPNSNPGSRSPSPSSGRVSPFRGRGFNPTGSRHASPAPSPPPDIKKSLPKSQIPQYTRRSSISPFGEKVRPEYDIFDNDVPSQRSKRPVTSGVNLSKSLGNISSTRSHVPRKNVFSKLSPIMGSSPEPSEHASNKSSPSKIPRSKSQPPSRIMSPNGSRNPSRAASRADSRTASRNTSRNVSREPSRDQSRDSSPTNKYQISSNRTMSYRNIVSRVDSYHKLTKGKVSSNKPPVPTNNNNNSKSKQVERSSSNAKANLQRLTSVTRFKSNVPKSNESRTTKSRNQNSNISNKSDDNVDDNGNRTDSRAGGRNMKSITKSKITKANNFSKMGSKTGMVSDKTNANNKDTTTTEAEGDSRSDSEESVATKASQIIKKVDSSSRLAEMMAPSTTAIVSTTTSTVTQPLNIDAHLEDIRSISSNDNPIMTSSATGSGRNTPSSAKALLSHTSSAASIGKSSQQPTPAPLTTSNSEKSITTTTKGSARSRLSLKARSIISMGTISEGNRSRQQTVEEVPSKPGAGSSALPVVETVVPQGQGMGSSNLTINNNVPPEAGGNRQGGAAATMESNVKNNISKIISPDNAITSVNNAVQKSGANDNVDDGRTKVAADVKPIRITVREKGADMEVQSGNVRLPASATNGVGERQNLPPSSTNQQSQDAEQGDQSANKKPNVCSRLLASCRNKVPSSCCKKKQKDGSGAQTEGEEDDEDEDGEGGAKGCFKCRRKKKKSMGTESVQTLREAESADEDDDEGQQKGRCARCWARLKCCRSNKVADASKPTGCCPFCRKKTKKDPLANRSVSMVGKPPTTGCSCKPKCQCSKTCCKNFLKNLFCFPCIGCKKLCRKKPKPSNADDSNRRASQLTQKKSMTSTVHPVEDTRPKLDISLVEHSSHMKGAIPILPIPIAWICLILNVFLPGVGTLCSGLICLCIGRPRFSPYDGMKQRFGALLINIIIAFSQFFTVLFCFVGWGWSIWWGVIMLKIAKKYRRVKLVEAERERLEAANAHLVMGPDGHPLPHQTNHHLGRDLERGS